MSQDSADGTARAADDPPEPMTVDEFLVWSETQDGRWELHDGIPVRMAAERTGHAKAKFRAQVALDQAIERAGKQCHMLPDGATIRITDDVSYEPDALVYCGEELADDTIEVPEPVIIVEVLSPSTRNNDMGAKYLAYIGVPSVQHYLLIDPAGAPIIHHRRKGPDTWLTQLVRDGEIVLDPPGLTISVKDLNAERI